MSAVSQGSVHAPTLRFPPVTRRLLQVLPVLGLGALGVGAAMSPVRAYSSLLTSGFYFLTLALGGLVFLSLMSVANAGWATALKRIPEAFASYVPLGAGSLLVVLSGLPVLYLWARPGVMETDHLLHLKAGFLNAPFFIIRMVLVLAVWVGFAWKLRRDSLAQDEAPGEDMTRRSVATAAGFLVVFALTFCLASFDWLMTLEPHWFSTIYGLYNIAGLLASTMAALVVAAILARRTGFISHVNPSHLHDLGKLMKGFATFWAYMWFSQFLLIWYSNIPEETTYFALRLQGGWAPLFWANLVLNWALPFVLLLPRPAKRSEPHLLGVAAVMLVGRWLDVHLMVTPANFPEAPGVGLWDVAAMVGLGSLFVLTVVRALTNAPALPRGDPYLVESLHHHQ